MLPKFLTNGDKQMVDHKYEPPPLPARAAPQPRQYSDVAARAAQHVHDLEMTIEAAQADIHALTARLTVADERARVIQAENEFMMKDRDYHKERCVRIETKLNSAAQLILDCMGSAAKPEDEVVTVTMADFEKEVMSGNTTYDPNAPTTNTTPEPPRNGNGKKAKQQQNEPPPRPEPSQPFAKG
jgi:hypothetical protein